MYNICLLRIYVFKEKPLHSTKFAIFNLESIYNLYFIIFILSLKNEK